MGLKVRSLIRKITSSFRSDSNLGSHIQISHLKIGKINTIGIESLTKHSNKVFLGHRFRKNVIKFLIRRQFEPPDPNLTHWVKLLTQLGTWKMYSNRSLLGHWFREFNQVFHPTLICVPNSTFLPSQKPNWRWWKPEQNISIEIFLVTLSIIQVAVFPSHDNLASSEM